MNTASKLTSTAWSIFYALFTIAFAPGIMFIFFRSRIGTSPILLPVITIFLVIPVLINAWWLTGRVANILSEKTQKTILIAFMFLSAILQLYIGSRLRFTPMWDVEAIFHGGRLWALTGTLDNHSAFHGSYHRYFAMFSNQWGGLFLFRVVFWVYSFFDGTDYHVAALIWNVAMVQAMVYALYSAAKRFKGLRAGLFVLVLLCIFLPFHFFGVTYYTDTLSLPFIAIAFALYLRAKDEQLLHKKLLFFAACGLAVAVGAAIKATVLIMIIAIVIDLLLRVEKGWLRQRLLGAGVAVLVFATVFGGFNMYMERWVIAPEMTEQYRIPRAHWAMMGLRGYGHYSPDDFFFTMGIPDLATRQSETSRVFRERARELGVTGFTEIYAAKFSINFGDGTYQMQRIFHQDPVNQTRIHDVTYGRHFNAYMHYASGFTTALMLLMLVGAVHMFLNPKETARTAVPWLSFFGLVVLLTFWESGGRLTMNHFPMLVVGAVYGLSIIEPMLAKINHALNRMQDFDGTVALELPHEDDDITTVAPDGFVGTAIYRKSELEQLIDYVIVQKRKREAMEKMVLTALQNNFSAEFIEVMRVDAGISDTRLAELKAQAG